MREGSRAQDGGSPEEKPTSVARVPPTRGAAVLRARPDRHALELARALAGALCVHRARAHGAFEEASSVFAADAVLAIRWS